MRKTTQTLMQNRDTLQATSRSITFSTNKAFPTVKKKPPQDTREEMNTGKGRSKKSD